MSSSDIAIGDYISLYNHFSSQTIIFPSTMSESLFSWCISYVEYP